MKRKGHLIRLISEIENLYVAWYKAKKGKEAKPEIQEYGKNLENQLKDIQLQLISGNVKVGNYHYFKIFDPKERLICAASFKERVIHHAIMNICHPYFENYQVSDSYATRLDKGTFKAVDRAWYFLKHNRYYLKMDIRKYFDNIDHFILFRMLEKEFKDNGLLSIFWQIIDSYSTKPGKGIPIGNLTSQYFANHYLASLDRYVKENLQVKAYVRYMDDFVIFHNDMDSLSEIEKLVNGFISNKLLLNLKTNFINSTVNGLTFLGFRLFPFKKLLSVRSKKRYTEKMHKITNGLNKLEISQKEFQQRATALNAFVEKAYSKSFRRKVIENYPVVE